MKKYAICGISSRAIWMFIKPIVDQFADTCQLVALLDKDPLRFSVCRQAVPNMPDIPTFKEIEFDKMVDETRPDVVIVAGADYSHVTYTLAALAKGLDVIVEKPMTTTAADAAKVLQAERTSGKKVTVTFNYRYPAIHRKIKEMLIDNTVGRIISVDLNWYIDTYHGASYFKRWNRLRKNSGGLSIHKCSHHFDLLNWWLDQDPVEVYALGALNYYGAKSAKNPSKEDGRHCASCPVRTQCAYEMRWNSRHPSIGLKPKDDHLDNIIRSTEQDYTNYRSDQCIFDSEIDIEDTYSAVIRYDKGAQVSYSATFSTPYEGYRLAINGTLGRIETQEYHAPSRVPFPVPEQTIFYYPLFGGAKENIHVLQGEGGHGGGDVLILEDLFMGSDPNRHYEILAGARAGALSVAIGEAVWRSVAGKRPYRIDELLGMGI